MTEQKSPSRPWEVLWRFRTPIDPDHGGPTSTVTLWQDNLDGLALGMDYGDGQSVIVLPIPGDDLDDLCAAVLAYRTMPLPPQNGPSDERPEER